MIFNAMSNDRNGVNIAKSINKTNKNAPKKARDAYIVDPFLNIIGVS